MKKILCIVFALLLISAAAFAEGLTTGGWKPADSPAITEENKALFEKGTEKLLGVDYTPVAFLGSQIVAGTNYCFLAQAKSVIPDAQPSFKLVFLYEKLDGTVEVLSIVDFDFGALCEY